MSIPKCKCGAPRKRRKTTDPKGGDYYFLCDKCYSEYQRPRARARAQRNKKTIIPKVRAWQAEHPDRVRAATKRYSQTPKGKAQVRKHSAKRRTRKLNQFVEDVDPTVVFEMYGGMCGICEEFIVGKFHVDHVIPLSKGGLHCYANCQPAHPACNIRKGNN